MTRPVDDPIAWGLCLGLRQRRLALGVTQVELATRLGVTPAAVCNWEHGRHSPHLVLLVQWANELGWEIAVGEPGIRVEEDEL